MSLDIEKVIDQSYQSHTKKTKENDIGLLSIEQAIVDKSIVFQYKRKSYHQKHYYQKNTSSHSGGSLFVFMELSKYFGFFSSYCCFTDSLTNLIFSEYVNVDRIKNPRNEKRNQRKHNDVI
jgi:hypothetical protein